MRRRAQNSTTLARRFLLVQKHSSTFHNITKPAAGQIFVYFVDLRGVARDSRLVATHLGLGTASRLELLRSHRSGVQLPTCALRTEVWTYGESNPDLVHAMDAFYR